LSSAVVVTTSFPMPPPDTRRLKPLEDENAKLRKLVADLLRWPPFPTSGDLRHLPSHEGSKSGLPLAQLCVTRRMCGKTRDLAIRSASAASGIDRHPLELGELGYASFAAEAAVT